MADATYFKMVQKSFLEFKALQHGRCFFSYIHPNASTHQPSPKRYGRQAGHPHPVLVLVNLGNVSLITKDSLPTKLESRLLRLFQFTVRSAAWTTLFGNRQSNSP